MTVLLATARWGAGEPALQLPPGKLIITNFVSAPFPHPLRAAGHSYKGTFFSAAEHYQDSRVALFIPKGFRAEGKIDFVVHFHGWGNDVTNALREYRLLEQFSASSRNAILIVPQGPFDASDSFGGKLEDTGGFNRFIAEALKTLRANGIIDRAGPGRIILSGHSGGYEVIAAILEHGGLTANIREVWLFDALYARTPWFAQWFDRYPGRFIDLYTDNGGTRDETEALMKTLAANGAPYFKADETNATADDLRDHHLIFLFSELPHNDVLQGRNTFQRFLETSSLDTIGPKSVRNVEVRDAPDARGLAEQARRIGNEVYPRIRELLGDSNSDTPQQLDIVFREVLNLPQTQPGAEALGYATRNTVFLNAGLLNLHPENLDGTLVHEMAHIAQNYPHMAYRHAWQFQAHWLGFKLAHPFRNYPPFAPTYWVEGIADYVCAKLGHTNALDCPQCDGARPTYTAGYNCTAAFLLYIDDEYGSDVIRRLNATLRRGNYSDQFFAEATGKTLVELWTDFQATSAFTPIAGELNELHEALGYDNGKPPKDLAARVEKYFSKHPDIREFFTTVALWKGRPPEDVQQKIGYVLYTRQKPGGERAVREIESSLNELHQALGAKDQKPPGDSRKQLLAYLDAHPDLKQVVVAEGWLETIPLPEIQGAIESLIFARSQDGWARTVAAEEFLTRLKRQGKLPGWRDTEHGMLQFRGFGPDTYPVDRTFESHKNGDSKIYIFTVVKESADSDWKLKRAWETTAKGRLVKDFAAQ